MKKLFFAILVFLFSSCCQEVQCEYALPIEDIRVELIGYTDQELEKVALQVFNKQNKLLLGTDTLDLRTYASLYVNQNTVFQYGNHELFNYFFVINTQSTSDTLHAISYNKVLEEFGPCGNCLWKKEEPSLVWVKRDFTFKVNEKKYDDVSLSVTISK